MTTTAKQPLRTIDNLRDALETLYNQQSAGQLDAKTADAMNTTLKGAMYLNVRLPMEALKIFVTASIKKVTIPEGLRKALPISVE